MSIYTCLGEESSQTQYRRLLISAAQMDQSFTWSIAMTATHRDTALFYLTGPLAGEFVAYGVVADSLPKLDARDGRYNLRADDLTMLPKPVPRKAMLRRLPWGWLKQPRMSSRVPYDLEPRLLRLPKSA